MDDRESEHIIADSRNEKQTAAKHMNELNELIKKLYEGNATGKIFDKHFSRLLADYDSELSALEARTGELDKIIAQGMDKLVVKNPQSFQCITENEVSKTYSMPRNFISIHSKEHTITFTEEQKEQISKRLHGAE